MVYLNIIKNVFLRNDGVKKLVSPKTDKQICPKQNSNNKKWMINVTLLKAFFPHQITVGLSDDLVLRKELAKMAINFWIVTNSYENMNI